VIDILQYLRIRPDLRFGHAAVGRDIPTIGHSLRPTFMTEPTSRPLNSRLRRVRRWFIPAALEHAALNDSEFVADLCAGPSTPRIGTLASVPVERLGRLMITATRGSERPLRRARHAAHRRSGESHCAQAADHLAIGPAAQDDGCIRRTGATMACSNRRQLKERRRAPPRRRDAMAVAAAHPAVVEG